MSLVLVALAVAGVWAWTRPVPLSIVAVPQDALLTLDGGLTEAGAIEVADAKPGEYHVTVARTGFETATATVRAARIRGGALQVVLRPMPQKLFITAVPDNARIAVFEGDDKLAEKTGALSTRVAAGEVRIEVSAPGRNRWTKQLFLDSPTSMEVRLDPKGQVVHGLAWMTTAGAPKGVALSPDGREAWTSILNGPPSIQIFNPRTGKKLGGVDLGEHGAVEVIFNKRGTRAYASQMETARVFEIDTKRRKVLRSFDTESAWTKVVALSPDGKTLYAANWSGDDVSEIDLETGKLRRRIPVADTPRGLWPTADGKTLWVAGFGAGDLERVDLATGKVKRAFKSGGALRHLVADEKRHLLYASDMGKDCVWVTDMRTNKTKKFANVDAKPNTIDLSPDGKVLFVSNRGENNPVTYYLPGPEWGTILLYATEGAKPLDAIIGGNQCTALDVSDDGRLLAFSDFLDNRLRTYEVPSYADLAAGKGGLFPSHTGMLKK